MEVGQEFFSEQLVFAWLTPLINKLLFAKGVGKVNFDQCMFEMKGRGFASPATRRRCSGKWKTPTRQDAGVEDHGMPDVSRRDRNEGENSSDNTSGVLGRLSLGPSETKDITGTVNELINLDS